MQTESEKKALYFNELQALQLKYKDIISLHKEMISNIILLKENTTIIRKLSVNIRQTVTDQMILENKSL